MAELEIKSVSKSFGSVEVLHDVNLNISSGEFVVFVGPSGCGKSTLLRTITGLETESSGDISIDGQRSQRCRPGKARHGNGVPVLRALPAHDGLPRTSGFGLKMAGEPKATIREKVTQASAILRLETLLDRRPGQLSGGQKQRVAIGRAIVRKPKVFLFDEPLSNLDAELRVQMRSELIDLHRRLGATMIYVTHDQVEAMTLADRIVVMSGGVVQQYGRPLRPLR